MKRRHHDNLIQGVNRKKLIIKKYHHDTERPYTGLKSRRGGADLRKFMIQFLLRGSRCLCQSAISQKRGKLTVGDWAM